MSQIRVDIDGFSLSSSWRVVTGSQGVKEIVDGPSTASKTVTFEYKLPAGTKVKSAQVHSTWGSPLSGYSLRTVNGSTPDASGMVSVDIDTKATSVDVVFRFRANGDTSTTGNRSATASVSEIYLLIETVGGCIYRAENGVLVPYQLYRAENGVLVPYQFQHAENGALAPYGG